MNVRITIDNCARHAVVMLGRKAKIRCGPARAGNQQATLADTTRLPNQLKREPLTSLDDGLARQCEWQQSELASEVDRY